MDGRAQRKKVADATNERGFEFGGRKSGGSDVGIASSAG